MPHSARIKDIEAYNNQIEKGEIHPCNLPKCHRCNKDSSSFKLHSYRERVFYVIVEMVVKFVRSALVRFKCPGCGKTYVWYPDFALPYKRYTRQAIVHFSKSFVDTDETTYKQAVMVGHDAPGYQDDDRTLSPSTIHRWISTCGRFEKIIRTSQELILQKDPATSFCRDIAQVNIAPHKYRSLSRKTLLERCWKLVKIEATFNILFQVSIFTNLGIRCGFS